MTSVDLTDLGNMRLGDIAEGRLGSIAVYRSHDCHAVWAVCVKYMLDDLVAPARAEICVDIRRCCSGRVEKTLEIEIEP